MIVKLINNHLSGSIIEDISVPGYSHYSIQRAPNCGIDIKTNDNVCFYNYSTIKIPDKDLYYIDDEAVFLKNDKLVKDGVVVIPKKYSQADSGFTFCEQSFFTVIDTNCEIPIGSVVVCKERTAYKFDANKRFVPRLNVLFFVNSNIQVVNEKLILERPNFGVFEKVKKKVGILNNDLYFFRSREAEINISGKLYYIVNKKDIYAIQADQSLKE